VVVEIEVKDPATYQQYVALAPASVQAHGGTYLARAGRTEKLEGDWLPRRLVILEFASVELAREWLDSPDYAPVKKLRHQSASTNMVVIESA
jgi:uncharacterized protein (DUF1330 family)